MVKETENVEQPRWVSAVPMIRTEQGNWSKVHMNDDGTFGRDVEAHEADAIGAYRFYLLRPDSDFARQALGKSDD